MYISNEAPPISLLSPAAVTPRTANLQVPGSLFPPGTRPATDLD